MREALEQIDFSAFPPVAKDPDVIPCASEKEARFITPDVDVGETIECTPDLVEDILEAEEERPVGASFSLAQGITSGSFATGRCV